MYYIIAYLLKIFLRIFGRIDVYNKQVLPSNGPYVIACTHTGWVDVIYLGTTLLPSRIHYMAKKQLFDNKLFSWLLKKLNAFPVDRENPGPSVLKIPNRLLSKGEIVGIFPSGTRTHEQIALKQGAITIAQRSNVPIVPVAYKGPNNLKELFSRKKPYLIFGEPIYITSKDKEERLYFTNFLEQTLTNLEKEISNNS
ncbi:1-acyl-sn-glycerol-3-phosphate acyltransferase [Cytobacillus oceanisediminis]|uniref:1-acyl-sn-glycerol-3-phosphate acyltransferase n=1 Tax=Cytobacillus oceanisediminis TaxID=665099 RepID=A0A2V3A661_9BACI|nr:1-acyl-sn-glycerol-3-phosphate acyltransferase [Cytobacillus oceanisediminis]PWW32493.1 1-acyl-sn-glycerol-3-phosphate acyltransferase [Cytobacillus oceanisediminis]